MTKTTNQNENFGPKWLSGPWPVVGLLICHFLLGLTASRQKSFGFDEITHLSSGYTYWVTGDFRMDPESGNWPQRWVALPLWLGDYRFPTQADASWQVGDQWGFADHLFHAIGNDADAMLLAGRAMQGLLSVLLGAMVYLWSRQLSGALGGLISVALYAFSPTMLANGFLVTADLMTAFFFSAAVWCLWQLLQRITWFTLAGSTFALAGLFLSKFSAPLIVPMGLLLLGIRLFNSKPLDWTLGQRRVIQGRWKLLLVVTGVVVYQICAVALLIWVSYDFRYSARQPSAAELKGAVAVAPYTLPVSTGVAYECTKFAWEHQLLPEAYLYGFGFTLYSTQGRESFLNGEFSLLGRVRFFPYALLVKTPLEFFLVFLLACVGFWRWRREERLQQRNSKTPTESSLKWYLLSPWLVLIGVYWTVSLASDLNIGHRHLLPTYPPMFVLAGAAAFWFRPSTTRPAPQTGGKRDKGEPGQLVASKTMPPSRVAYFARMLIALSLLLSAGEALGCWPNYVAYFNVLAGGSANGYKHLVDSSLDWGQDLKGLKQWLADHPDAANPPDRVYLCYFGTSSPDYYGIKATRLPGFFNFYTPHLPEPLTGGTYCISATLLQGIYLDFPGRWNQLYENIYQQCRKMVTDYRQALGNNDELKKVIGGASQSQIDQVWKFYENLRLARLFSFLRQRTPDADVGHSIMIYQLTDAEVQQALEGPPGELLPDPEPGVRQILQIKQK